MTRSTDSSGRSGSSGGELRDKVRPAQQERSRASFERVLAAGAELLADEGYEAFTITEVGRRAGASAGLIYGRFKNKAALFEAILLREMGRMVKAENSALEALADADLPIAELIEQAVHQLAVLTRRDARLTEVFSERAMQDPHLVEHVKRARTSPRLFAQLLLDRREELANPDPERAADMAFWLANSALERRVHTEMWRHWDSDAPDDWDLFVADLASALKAYLLRPPID